MEKGAQLACRLDLILCTGALHPLVALLAGMRDLEGCLRDEGVIATMLYARIGMELMRSISRELSASTSRKNRFPSWNGPLGSPHATRGGGHTEDRARARGSDPRTDALG